MRRFTYVARLAWRRLWNPGLTCRHRWCVGRTVGFSVWCREHTDAILARGSRVEVGMAALTRAFEDKRSQLTPARYLTVDPSVPRIAHRTPAVTDWLLIDVADDGHILGIEVLGDHTDTEVLIALAGSLNVDSGLT